MPRDGWKAFARRGFPSKNEPPPHCDTSEALPFKVTYGSPRRQWQCRFLRLGAFRAAYSDFVAHMQSIGLVDGTDPIGRRQSDTPMDTDSE